MVGSILGPVEWEVMHIATHVNTPPEVVLETDASGACMGVWCNMGHTMAPIDMDWGLEGAIHHGEGTPAHCVSSSCVGEAIGKAAGASQMRQHVSCTCPTL